MRTTVRFHWPEYLAEAVGLGLFLMAAAGFGTLIHHPLSPVRAALADPLARRVAMGLAMGLTAVGLIYSPWGRRSGAQLNPAVTLTFLRLGMVGRLDAALYVAAQVAGGVAGLQIMRLVLGSALAVPEVDFVATRPGAAGAGVAFLAELVISFLLMGAVLASTNAPRWAGRTGWIAGTLVATFITFEDPLSGMSMNPARTAASAVAAGGWSTFWIYATAPLAGMLLAAEAYLRGKRAAVVHCAKLHHDEKHACIFRCGYHEQEAREAGGAGTDEGRAMIHSTTGPLALRRGPAVLALFVALQAGPAAAGPAVVEEVGPVGLTVADLDRSVEFYTGVLGFEASGEVELAGEEVERLQGVFGLRARVARLRLGDETIELTDYLAPEGRPLPQDSRSHDRWFQHVAIIVADMPRAYRHLRAHDVRHASPGPQRLPDWNPHAGGIEAFYFKDPDGHALEILAFPPDKGDPRWHVPGERLFLGIDHTAIVVADTEASLGFYRDLLGLRVAGASENYGPEQERLNNVFGARLRITALRAARGPGIELLEYLAPGDGRPYPADARANDLLHWQTDLTTGDLAQAADRLRRAGASHVSPGVVRTDHTPLAFGAGLTVRDPDGHALRLVGPSSGEP
jgi:catechol 2,3-dioxygenase-like lactoylglutathione lyase family enzyme/glycerol uptake facilitator-like aquaporin